LFSTPLSALDGRITELTCLSLGNHSLPTKLLGGFLLNLVCGAQSGYPSVFIQLKHVNTNPSLYPNIYLDCNSVKLIIVYRT